MKIHIGCGTVYLNGYINIDGAPDYLAKECPPDLLDRNATTFDRYYKQKFGTLPGHVVADLEYDIGNALPFPNMSVDEVVMYQVLEHIPHYDVDKVLDDIYRVLRIGGTFFVSVPDLKETARILVDATSPKDEDWAIRLIHGTQRNKWSHHFCGFVPRTLKELLSKHGFGSFEDMPIINCYPAIHIKAIKENS